MKPTAMKDIEEEAIEILKANGIKMYELENGGVNWPLYMFEYIPKSELENNQCQEN